MTEQQLITGIHKKLAIDSVGASTVRGQGVSGIVDSARAYLGNIDLIAFSVQDADVFRGVLDRETELLRKSLPQRAQTWGIARKCLNIFLREAFYNAYLREYYHLTIAEEWYEIPLDNVVAKKLRRRARLLGQKLPQWNTIKSLDVSTSDAYQAFALEVSQNMGIARVHLDTFFWVEGR